MATTTKIRIDWSVPQICLGCNRQMRKSDTRAADFPGLIKYGSKGHCSTCDDRLLSDGTLRPLKTVDWSVPQHCTECGKGMTKRYEPDSGKNSWGHGGVCHLCRSKELRRAKGAKPKLPQVFDSEGKVCTYCQKYKTYDEYGKDVRSASGHSSYCRRCNRLRCHKVDAELYYGLVDTGEYCCQICDKTEEENGQHLSIDHDHSCCPGQLSCGKCFRGFLCNDCNWALGLLKDSVESLDRAKAYLLKYEAVKVAYLN